MNQEVTPRSQDRQSKTFDVTRQHPPCHRSTTDTLLCRNRRQFVHRWQSATSQPPQSKALHQRICLCWRLVSAERDVWDPVRCGGWCIWTTLSVATDFANTILAHTAACTPNSTHVWTPQFRAHYQRICLCWRLVSAVFQCWSCVFERFWNPNTLGMLRGLSVDVHRMFKHLKWIASRKYRAKNNTKSLSVLDMASPCQAPLDPMHESV